MSVDKNLFLYDLAVVAIFKNEAPYLKEWLDYHLLAGVEHFYLYDNGSTDDYEKILAPYVEANLVTLTDWPGEVMQMPAYDDAFNRYRFFCRYMALIDVDEFLFPRTGQSIVEVVDEILSPVPNAGGLTVNWQVFGSNGEQSADLNRGVLERFTRRAPDDWRGVTDEDDVWKISNSLIKSIVDPRKTAVMAGPHVALYFGNEISVDERGEKVEGLVNDRIPVDKIVLNHYYIKSREEFAIKVNRGSACRRNNHKRLRCFEFCDCNEVFDDGILKYRAARAKNFSLEDDAQRIQRVEKILVETLTERSPFDAPADFFVDKLETFLTCRAVAELLGTKIGSRSAEEFALVWIYQTLANVNTMTHGEFYALIKTLPEILARPFPLCGKINELTQSKFIPAIYESLKSTGQWGIFAALKIFHRLLKIVR